MSGHLRVTVIVAAIDARATVAASLRGFAEEVRGRGDVLLVDSSSDDTPERAGRLALPGVRIVHASAGRLVPHLWHIGIEATDTPLVALSTAQMVPQPGWFEALLDRLEETGAAAVGGPIEPAPGLARLDQAVYLQRYVNYLRPLGQGRLVEPPGDNALYRRDRLDGLEPLLSGGFWESEVHRVLRGRGEVLAMTDDAVLRFHGGALRSRVTGQRHRHARQFGAQRAARMGDVERLVRTLAVPVVPWVLLHRIKSALAGRGEPLGHWLPALPWLGLLLAAWSTGEALGTWLGPAASPRAAERSAA